VHLPQPRPGDEQDREGDQVAADDELELGPRGVQVGVDRRRADVRDGGVGLRHEGRDEQDGQQPVSVGPRRACRGPCRCDAPPAPGREAPCSSAHANEKRATSTVRVGHPRGGRQRPAAGTRRPRCRSPCRGSARGTIPPGRPRPRGVEHGADPHARPRSANTRSRLFTQPDAGSTAWASATKRSCLAPADGETVATEAARAATSRSTMSSSTTREVPRESRSPTTDEVSGSGGAEDRRSRTWGFPGRGPAERGGARLLSPDNRRDGAYPRAGPLVGPVVVRRRTRP
jgi:hypothetical protein